ncbi:MAG TPA: DUF190 domain-containing protein [Candidatus Nitrosotenuis sp.]|nr:DUF190 domain-containing protein [Candidatus Nitrosotenuis sp.]
MTSEKVKRVSIYINEADEWHGRPVYLEILRYLQQQGCAGGTVLRGVAGFTRAAGVVTTSLVDAGGKLPLVIEYIDAPAKVERVLPKLREIAGDRLITLEDLELYP